MPPNCKENGKYNNLVFNNPSPSEEMILESEICKFYNGKNVFLTGATGCIGKYTLEKLLRSCSGINKIYVLVRHRKNSHFSKRVMDMTKQPLFDGLKEVFFKKVVPIEGDLGLPQVGLSEENQFILRRDVNVVFHCAATVKFDEVFKKALKYNVKATFDIMEFCSTMQNLESIVHVSTAFSHSHKYELEEKIYPYELNYSQIENIMNMSDKDVKSQQKKIMGGWNTSYTFSKAATERMIAEKFYYLPVSIFRPAVVHTSSDKHPIVGYIDNIYDGLAGMAYGVFQGVFRVQYMRTDSNVQLIPADYCVNAMLVIAYFTALQKNLEPKVYNYAPSHCNSVTWYKFIECCKNIIESNPVPNAYWYCKLSLTPSRSEWHLLKILYHYLPAYTIDMLLRVAGKKPKMVQLYNKVHQLNSRMIDFAMRKHDFPTNNIIELNDKLSPVDKELFYTDMRIFDWNKYYHTAMQGLRKYLCKENPESIPAGIRKNRKLAVLHYITLGGVLFGMLYSIWTLFALFF